MSASVTNLTLNRLIEEFSVMSSDHEMLESFFYGDFNKIISSNKIKHTALLMNTSDGVLDENFISFRLELACMDKVFNDQSNLNDVESDTIQILQDIFSVISYSNRWQSFSKVQSSATVRKFISKGEDMVTGWSMTLNLQVKRKNGICSVPLEGYNFEGSYTSYCAGVRIFEDGILVEVVPSGGRYDYTSSGGSIDVYVNDILFFAGATSNQTVPVKDEGGVARGSKVGINWEITDADQTLNGVPVVGQRPETTKAIKIQNIDAVDVPLNILTNSLTELTAEVPNVQVTVNGDVFESGAPGSTVAVSVVDSGGIDEAGGLVTGKWKIEDSTVVNKNSVGTVINSPTVKAEKSIDNEIPDNQNTFQGDAINSTPSGETMNIQVLDQDDNEIGTLETVDPNNAIIRVDTSEPESIGTIFDIDFSTLANLNDFTVVNPGGATYTLDAGLLKITGTPSTSFGGNALMYNNYLCGLKKYKLEIYYIIKSLPASNEGMIGTIKGDSTLSATIRRDSFVHFRNSSSPANGHGYRYLNDSTTLTPNIFSTAPLVTAVAPVIDHSYKMIIERDMNNCGASINVTIVDLTTENSNNGTLTYNYANTSGQLDYGSSKFGVGTIGGTHWVSRMKLTTTEKINANIVFVVDSIGTGYCADSRANSYFEKIVEAHPDLIIVKSGLQGDKPSTAVNRSAEFALINASKYFFHIGTNGVIASGAAVAFANYQTMVNNAISANGTEFVHGYALPRVGNAAINAFNALILSTYGGQPGHTVVDSNTPFNNGSNAMNPLLANSDLIHPNTLGHTTLFNLFDPFI
jgi:hypothetical protein